MPNNSSIPWTCIDCGARVSTSHTKRCRPCSIRAPRKPPTRRWTPNSYRIERDVAFLSITNRAGNTIAETHVDVSMLPDVLMFRWAADGNGYACCMRVIDGKNEKFFLHRVVLGLTRGDQRLADHINRDKLDNRLANLRIVDRAINAANRATQKTSRFTGVHWDAQTGRWMAMSYRGSKTTYLGRFDSEVDAANAVAKQHACPPSAAASQ